MGIFKALGWEDETPKKDEVEIDPHQDFTPQMKNVNNASSINVLAPKPQPVQVGNTMFGTGVAIQLSEADKTKWQEFCMNLYATAKQENPIYNKFLNNYDALASVPIPEAQKIGIVASQLKGDGISKAQIVAAVNNALKSISDGKLAFEKNHGDKVRVQIDEVTKAINDKQTQINTLGTEIQKLGAQLQENQAGLSARLLGFNTFFAQVNEKVTADVANITNFIPE